jgi:hypothetical protein
MEEHGQEFYRERDIPHESTPPPDAVEGQGAGPRMAHRVSWRHPLNSSLNVRHSRSGGNFVIWSPSLYISMSSNTDLLR